MTITGRMVAESLSATIASDWDRPLPSAYGLFYDNNGYPHGSYWDLRADYIRTGNEKSFEAMLAKVEWSPS
jgi:hypothetical protein